jgi:hypothetical protein
VESGLTLPLWLGCGLPVVRLAVAGRQRGKRQEVGRTAGPGGAEKAYGINMVGRGEGHKEGNA